MDLDRSKSDNRKSYDTKNISVHIEEMMVAYSKEQPDEPIIFMLNFIQNKARQCGLLPIHPNNTQMYDTKFQNVSGSALKRQSITAKSENGRSSHSKNNFNILNDNNQTIEPLTENSKENISLDQEFKLVTEMTDENILETLEPDQNIDKSFRHSSKTKEDMLIEIEKNRQKEIEEKVNLESKVDNNENNDVVDYAVELAEDPDFYSNEFRQNNLNEECNQNGQEKIVIKEKLPQNEFTENGSVKLGVCVHCSKYYQLNENEINPLNFTKNYTSAKGSLILDDLESASQVNGPRRIDSPNSFDKFHSKSSKKKISVSDFETTSKAWPVLTPTSDISRNPLGSGRSKN